MPVSSLVDSTVRRVLIKPLGALSTIPHSYFYRPVRQNILPLSVLLSVEPVALVSPSVSPNVDPVAMFFVHFIVALVSTAIFPRIYAIAVHIVILP